MTLAHYLPTIQSERFRHFVETAHAMGVRIDVVSSSARLLRFQWKDVTRITVQDRRFLNSAAGLRLTKNKDLTRILLRDAGIAIPRALVARTFAEARTRMHATRLHFPVVVKPIDGSKGYGVTVNVTSDRELRQAIRHVRTFWAQRSGEFLRSFLVEKMHAGRDFRVLVLDGKAVACIERVPAHIIGDGRSSVAQIIERFNARRPASFRLHIDAKVRAALRNNDATLHSILPKGKKIALRKNANISSGGVARDCTQSISPRFRRLSLRAANALQLRFAGIDILTQNIASNNPRAPYVILEINGAPDYDIHEKPIVQVQGNGLDVTTLVVKSFMSSRYAF